MSGPTSWATINFPEKEIDPEIRKYLQEDYGVQFEVEEGPASKYFSVDIETADGIFGMQDGDASDGEFTELEMMLVEKGIPFDRETGMDWQIGPRKRIFRPGQFDLEIPLDGDGEPVVRVNAIREILQGKPEEGQENLGLMAYKKTIDLMAYLERHFPSYPSLADWAKESTPKTA
jgi:hypothetical protein